MPRHMRDEQEEKTRSWSPVRPPRKRFAWFPPSMYGHPWSWWDTGACLFLIAALLVFGFTLDSTWERPTQALMACLFMALGGGFAYCRRRSERSGPQA